VLISQVYTV